MKSLSVGLKGTAHTTVSESNTASAVGSGGLPVFATPMMIALMEKATILAINDVLQDDETTVGTRVEISHNAPSVLGQKVTANAVLSAIQGRKLSFDVTATDGNGIIGQGIIERFVVKSEKFMTKAENKNEI